MKRLHNVDCGVTQDEGGPTSFLKATAISTVYKVFQVVLTALGHQVVNLLPVGGLIPTRDESNQGGVFANFRSLTDW